MTMLLIDYINAGNKLFTSTDGLCDDDLLINRITSIYSTRTMRIDFTPEQIAATGQNVINVNKPILTQLFDYADKFNPFKIDQTITTTTGSRNNTSTDSYTKTNTGDRTTTNNTTDTTTNTGTTSTTGSTTDKPTTTTALTKSAYNATESRPAETTTVTGDSTATSTATATDDLTNTTKRTGTVTNADNLTESNDRTGTDSDTYSESVTTYGVHSANEIRAAFDTYMQPYDYLATLITREVCELVW